MTESGSEATAGAASEAAASRFYIPATAALSDYRVRVLKQGDSFAVFDHLGDIVAGSGGRAGLFHEDTRFLSDFRLLIDDRSPLLLSASLGPDNATLTVDLTNADIFEGEQLVLPRETLHLRRVKLLWDGALQERLVLRNYGARPRSVALRLLFAADFADLFEVRGQRRARRGRRQAERAGADCVLLHYLGLDGVPRRTAIRFAPPPAALSEEAADFALSLAPHERTAIFLEIDCRADREPRRDGRTVFYRALRAGRRALRAKTAGAATIASSGGLFDEVAGRAAADLYMLVTKTEHGLYPYAGIPWFSTAFGRDGIITALMTLWLDPKIARGVLHFLAATQAQETDESRDAEPGKILHERRAGEMARLREVPFDRYYGSVDATPLFVLLAGEYLRRTGDLESIRSLWPNIQAALAWIDSHGDRDGDGFVEYSRRSATGLANQGWKDSHDSIFHADSTDAAGPIALCEVQGYVFAAKRHAAAMARLLGLSQIAARLEIEAQALQEAFERAFWCEELSSYALALDGAKRPCRVVASNAGHALFAGIASPERARRVAETLLAPSCFSGWGIRTVATGAARYNPMSYHNGSVWPHDNAMIALGFARYGLNAQAARLLEAMFDAAVHMDLRRLPELFCGFPRRARQEPVSYPVACAPQAWAAAALFALLQASLGLSLDHAAGEARFDRPVLPPFLESLSLRNLAFGAEDGVDLLLRRHASDVSLNLLARRGRMKVVAVS